MRKAFAFSVALFLLGLVCLTQGQAQLPLTGAGKKPAGGGGGSCSQSTAWLARTSGLSGTETTAYDTMICGMVTDGVWSLLDTFYIFATNTQTTALLNLISTSFTGTTNGTVSFSADHGYTGDASTFYIDTGWKPTNGPNYTQNAASYGWYNLTSNTTGDGQTAMGEDTVNFDIFCIPRNASGNFQCAVNESSPSLVVANANKQGSYLLSRTTSVHIDVYKNGANILSNNALASLAIAASNNFIFADNSGAPARNFTSDQFSAAFTGGAMSATQAANFLSRLNAYMTALGINVY